jgi:DNA-directed RNA polymerase subunit RPC12/RpoP
MTEETVPDGTVPDVPRTCRTCEHRGYKSSYCSKLDKTVSPFSKPEWDGIMRDVREIRKGLTKQLAKAKKAERKAIIDKLKSLSTKVPLKKIVEDCPHWILHRPILPSPEELKTEQFYPPKKEKPSERPKTAGMWKCLRCGKPVGEVGNRVRCPQCGWRMLIRVRPGLVKTVREPVTRVRAGQAEAGG